MHLGYEDGGRVVKCACDQMGKIALLVTKKEGDQEESGGSTNLALLLSTGGNSAVNTPQEISYISTVGGAFSLVGMAFTILVNLCIK